MLAIERKKLVADESEKKQLLGLLIDKPLQFTDADFLRLLDPKLALDFIDIRDCVFRIFDINERIFEEESDANNALNRRSQKKRSKNFYQRFRNGWNRKENGNKVIVAEGDSWFEFPFFIDDIIDQLNKYNNYSIYSLAYGGDWLTNIIYDGRYVEKLSVFRPDVFLVSGGGNDLVGSDRIGIMVNPKGNCDPKYHTPEEISARYRQYYGSLDNLSPDDIKVFNNIQPSVTPAFHSFIWIMKLQYSLMFSNIHKKFPELKIITQAYDYALPSPKFYNNPFTWRFYVNRFLGTGRWMAIPLTIAGITSPDTQKQLVRFMIFEFNMMFAEIASVQPNVFHVDCRNVARGQHDWYDELHLKSDRFAVIGRAYHNCIESKDPAKKIYFAMNANESTPA